MTVRAAVFALTLVLLAPASPARAEPPSPLYPLLDAAALRLQTADPVAAFKWINGGPITDPARAQQVLDTVAADAAAHGVDASFVRTVFHDQIDATEGVEYTRFGQWKLDPGSAPHDAPVLTDSRAAIDGYNATMVNEIALQWDRLHGPGCGVELDAARRDVIDARGLDPLYAAALTSATRSYCTAT